LCWKSGTNSWVRGSRQASRSMVFLYGARGLSSDATEPAAVKNVDAKCGPGGRILLYVGSRKPVELTAAQAKALALRLWAATDEDVDEYVETIKSMMAFGSEFENLIGRLPK